MKKLCILLIASLITLYTYANEGFILKGRIEGDYAGYVYLMYPNHNDSTLVHNNTFEFSGNVDKPVLARLNLKPLANAVSFYLVNSTITVFGSFSIEIHQNEKINVYNVKSIEGSYPQKLLDEYITFLKANRKQENFTALRFAMLKQMFSTNPRQSVGGYILSGLILDRVDYTYEEFRELFALLDPAMMEQGDITIIKEGLRAINMYGVDQAFVKFNVPDQFDKVISSEKYRNKITLIDFWASWCGPCRAKHPELIALQKKYQAAGFTIVSISIDKDKAAWRKAITQDGLTWDNLLDTDHQLKNELSLPSIPFNYLLDKNGTILAVNQSLEKISLILEEKFK